MMNTTDTDVSKAGPAASAPSSVRAVVAVALLIIGGIWAQVIATSTTRPKELSDIVYATLETSGVQNPVTAVLLSFRAYDTLLELIVLISAVVGLWSLPISSQTVQRYAEIGADRSPVLDAVVKLLVPLMLLIGAYLLWNGIYGTGGAFQAGAVIASAAILLLLTGRAVLPLGSFLERSKVARGRAARVSGVFGPFVFVSVGLVGLAVGAAFLEYPSDHAGTVILLIELTCTVSIGVLLAAAFSGGAPASPGEGSAEESP